MTESVKEGSTLGGHSGDTEAMEGGGNCPQGRLAATAALQLDLSFPSPVTPDPAPRSRGSGSRAADRRPRSREV